MIRVSGRSSERRENVGKLSFCPTAGIGSVSRISSSRIQIGSDIFPVWSVVSVSEYFPGSGCHGRISENVPSASIVSVKEIWRFSGPESRTVMNFAWFVTFPPNRRVSSVRNVFGIFSSSSIPSEENVASSSVFFSYHPGSVPSVVISPPGIFPRLVGAKSKKTRFVTSIRSGYLAQFGRSFTFRVTFSPMRESPISDPSGISQTAEENPSCRNTSPRAVHPPSNASE